MKLSDYKHNKARIKILSERLKELSYESGMKSMCYDKDKLSPTFKFSSSTEDQAYSNIDSHDKIFKEYCKLELEINEADIALSILDPNEQAIITLRTIENQTWKAISESIGLGEKACRRAHQVAMEKVKRLMV